MPAYQLLTYNDLIDHGLDWLGVDAEVESRRDARRAAHLALSDLVSAHQWVYYMGRGRITTNGQYTTGTISYDHTGGTYERLVTLTSGTWPSWAAQGVLTIGTVLYEIASRISGTQITLSAVSNPGADVAALTTYTLFQDTYPMPTDFLAMGVTVIQGLATILTMDSPQQWLERQRIYRGVGTPRFYSLRGSPDYLGGLGIGFFPPPDSAYTIDFLYQRRQRPLTVESYATGTVTTTSGSTSVTAAGAGWSSRHEGTVFRPSGDTTAPTGAFGGNPAPWERIVANVVDSTTITLDSAAPESLSGVAYSLSDPVDIELGAMRTVLLRGVELQLAIARSRKDRDRVEMAYNRALILAREADSRNFRPEVAGGRATWPYRLAHFPGGPDVS